MTRWSVERLTSQLDGFRLGPVDLGVGPGEVVAVLGASGAGKTTLLRSVAGFLPVRAGRVVRDGTDLTAWSPEHRGLGYVPQGLGLLPHRTVERNVSYPLEVRGRTDAAARARAMLERFRLAPLAHRYPSQLSGGERERVALARALLAEPQLVLWDEPWQALDVEARHELNAVLNDLRSVERLPVIVVTHDPALAFAVADTFLVLRRGSPTFRGEPAELLQRPRDAFTARFAGYENVFDLATLRASADRPLAGWLAARAGADGVAFPRPVLVGPAPYRGAWAGVVRAARPTPEGLAVAVDADGLAVALRVAPPWDPPLPRAGDRLGFDLEEKTVRALGDGSAGTGTAA